MPQTKVEAALYELREILARDESALAFLRKLRDALGDAKWQALRSHLLAQYDARMAANRAAVPPDSGGLPEGSLEVTG